MSKWRRFKRWLFYKRILDKIGRHLLKKHGDKYIFVGNEPLRYERYTRRTFLMGRPIHTVISIYRMSNFEGTREHVNLYRVEIKGMPWGRESYAPMFTVTLGTDTEEADNG